MRTATAPELAVLAGVVYKVVPRLKVENGSGTMVDVTTWMEGFKIDVDIDKPVSELSVSFRRDNAPFESLAPFRGDSTLNRDDTASYSPLLDVGRSITLEVATIAPAATPVAGDYKLLFVGLLDVINWEHSPVSISARDLGGVLVDRWIETVARYGSLEGVPMEVVIQQILNAGHGAGVITLNVADDPNYDISPGYFQQEMSEMEAFQTLAQLRGMDIRYKFVESSGAFELTISEPPRSKTVPDYTFGPSQYFDVTSLFIDVQDIRNVVQGEYHEADTFFRNTVIREDATSETRYGRRFFKIVEGDDSPIDSEAEMVVMVEAALADLKEPKAEQEIELPFFWPIDLNDLYRFTENGVHYNSPQDWAVTSYSHEFTRNKIRTRIKVRGTPAGAYLNWLNRSGGTGLSQPETANALLDFRLIAEDTPPGTVTYGWTLGGQVAEVWLGQEVFTNPVPSDPWGIVLAGVSPLPVGTLTATFEKPPEHQVRYVQIEPRDAYLTPGRVQRLVINSAPTQAPTVELDDIETANSGTQWWKVTERGLAVTAVEVQTQIGIEPVSGWGAPTRGPGGASLVRGGVLGPLEYEHDVLLDPVRFSWIMPRISLENGEPPIVLGPFGFDRDKNPNILSITLNTISATQFGTIITAIADSDAKSVKVFDKNGTWFHHVDGPSISTDVSLSDPQGVAGLGSSAVGTYTVRAYSQPIAYIDGSTLYDERDIQVGGASAPAPGAVWDIVSLAAPAVGDTIAVLTLKASSAPVGYNVKVYIAVAISNPVPTDDHTADLSPALGAPPTFSTPYDYDVGSGFEAGASGLHCSMKAKCDLRNASNVVVDTQTVSASWYISP